MIIDSHAYCFEPADSLRGYESVEQHLRLVQQGQARHHQPAFRLSDRAAGPSEVLDPQHTPDPEQLPDLNFRIDKTVGRVVWDYQGSSYSKHYYPPALRNLEFTPHSLIGEMDYADINAVLLHTNDMLGRSNEYQAECVRAYPDRILSMAGIDEAGILTDVDRVIDSAARAVSEHGLHAFKFDCGGYAVSSKPWDGAEYRPLWDALADFGVPVFITVGTGPERGIESKPDVGLQQGYLGELRILMRLMARYPDLMISITHGFPYRVFLDGDRVGLPNEVWEPFQNPKLSMEVCFPVRIGDLFAYPFREIWPTLEKMVERIGPGQLMYGTDMPFQNRFCTYRQSRHWIERHFSPATGMGADDLALILGGTAARVLGLPPGR